MRTWKSFLIIFLLLLFTLFWPLNGDWQIGTNLIFGALLALSLLGTESILLILFAIFLLSLFSFKPITFLALTFILPLLLFMACSKYLQIKGYFLVSLVILSALIVKLAIEILLYHSLTKGLILASLFSLMLSFVGSMLIFFVFAKLKKITLAPIIKTK